MNLCQMLVGWKADKNGERGEEIDCCEPANWKSGTTFLCHACASEALVREDLRPSELERVLPDPPVRTYRGVLSEVSCNAWELWERGHGAVYPDEWFEGLEGHDVEIRVIDHGVKK